MCLLGRGGSGRGGPPPHFAVGAAAFLRFCLPAPQSGETQAFGSRPASRLLTGCCRSQLYLEGLGCGLKDVLPALFLKEGELWRLELWPVFLVPLSGKEGAAAVSPWLRHMAQKRSWSAAGRRKSQGDPAPCGPSIQLLHRAVCLPAPHPGSSSQLLGGEWLGFYPPLISSPFSVCNNLSGEVSRSVGGDGSQALMVWQLVQRSSSWFPRSIPPWAPPLEWK